MVSQVSFYISMIYVLTDESCGPRIVLVASAFSSLRFGFGHDGLWWEEYSCEATVRTLSGTFEPCWFPIYYSNNLTQPPWAQCIVRSRLDRGSAIIHHPWLRHISGLIRNSSCQIGFPKISYRDKVKKVDRTEGYLIWLQENNFSQKYRLYSYRGTPVRACAGVLAILSWT